MPLNLIDALVAITFGAGIMALLAIAYGIIERSTLPKPLQSVLLGSLFGSGAVLAMMLPVNLGAGIIFDSRAIIVGLAAAFGGWPVALFSAAIAGTARAYIGGAGAVAGIIGIFSASALGLFWAWRLKPEGPITPRLATTLGATISLSVISMLLLPQEILAQAFTEIAPAIVVSGILSALVMAGFLQRERDYISSERLWRENALTDPLTQLPNRRSFFHLVESTDAAPDRSNALLVLDADNFKTVNDRLGHAAGDAALVAIAEKIKQTVGKNGLICRLGGEEFAVFLPAVPRHAANQIAESLRTGIRDIRLSHEGAPVPLSISIGGVMALAASQVPLTTLLNFADDALYQAKADGRDKVVFMQPLATHKAASQHALPQPELQCGTGHKKQRRPNAKGRAKCAALHAEKQADLT